MKILPCREYHIFRRFQGDDGVNGEQMTDKPLDAGLWCAIQTMYRMSQDPDNYALDSYLKLVTFTPEDEALICGAILLESEPEVNRAYFLQFTHATTKKTYDVCTLDAGLWCGINTLCRHHSDRKLVNTTGGHFSLVFYHKGLLLTKAMLHMVA